MARRKPFRPSRKIKPLTWIGVFVLLLVYWLIARELESVDFVRRMPLVWRRILLDYPLLDTFTPIVAFFLELFSLSVLRHFIPVIGGFYLGYRVVLDLIRQLYVLPTHDAARKLFSHLRKGSDVTIPLNRLTFAQDREENPLLKVGGPNYVAVASGDVAVTEMNGRFERVLGGGRRHQLKRFEYVRFVLDLKEQEHEERNVRLTTRDSIDVLTDVVINFRIQRNSRRINDSHLFPFDAESVRTAAYTESMSGANIICWDKLPLKIAIDQLRDEVSRLSLDELIDPGSELEIAPHPNVQTRMRERTRQILRQYGLELTSARITGLMTDDRVQDKLLEYWTKFGSSPAVAEHLPQDPERMRKIKEDRIREQMVQNLAQGFSHMQEQGISMYSPPTRSLPIGELENILPSLLAMLRGVAALPISSDEETPEEGSQEVVTPGSELNELVRHLIAPFNRDSKD